MKKKSLIAPVYLILLFVFIFLTSCTNNSGLSQTNSSPTSENISSQTSSNPIVEETFLIIFDANGGEFEDNGNIKVVKGTENNLLKLPKTPLKHRSFYSFIGWSRTGEDNLLWDFTSDVVKTDMTLYAIWEEQNIDYRIVNNEAEIVDSKDINFIEIPSVIRDVDGKDYLVTTISNAAFLKKRAIQNVLIPKSILKIENSAFAECRNLVSVLIHKNLNYMGAYVFSNCDSLTIYCEVPSQPIGWNIHWNSSNRPIIWGIIDKSENELFEYAVSEDENKNKYITLTRYVGNGGKVIVPNFIEYNGENIPVTTIVSMTFAGCSLESIFIPKTIVKIQTRAFAECNISVIYCEVAVKPKEWSEYWNSSSLVIWGYIENIQIDSYSLVVMNDVNENKYINIIKYNGHATNIIIPSFFEYKGEKVPVKVISTYAFYDNKSLDSVFIPSSVDVIGDLAFCGDSNFIIYCETISQPAGWSVLWNLTNKMIIWGYIGFDEMVNEDYNYMIVQDNQGNKCIKITKYFGNALEVIIPEFIEYNGENLPVSVIGKYAFRNVNSLTHITLPSNLIIIEDYAFSGCGNLMSVNITNGVDMIGNGAFYGCSSLLNIIIPSSVTTMGYGVFSSCKNITIYCEVMTKPNGWNNYWNLSNLNNPVVWGYNSEN